MESKILPQIVDSLQDIFDEYDIIEPGTGGVEIEKSFYSFGNWEVCISISHYNSKINIAGCGCPGCQSRQRQSIKIPAVGLESFTGEVRAMIPIIMARTGNHGLNFSVVKGRNYTHLFIKDNPFG